MKGYIKKYCVNFYLLGLGIVILFYLPTLIQGQNALLIVHDQLDGDVLAYIEQIENLGSNNIPELFNGALKSSLTPASTGTLLFYYLFDPFIAYMVNYIFVAIIAYSGMYLCVEKFIKEKWICVVVGTIFAMLPFYSVYGLSVMGQPLLLWAVVNLLENKKKLKSYCVIVFFCVFSSLILVGYADALVMLILAIYMSVKRLPYVKNIWKAFGALVVIYCIEYYEILLEMLMPISTFITHKTEIVAKASPVKDSFKDILENGMYHAASCHKSIMYASILVLIIFVLYKEKYLVEKRKFFLGLIGLAVGIAGFYAFWRYWRIVDVRNKIGGLFVSFQVDRFYWLYPCIWFLIFGYVLWFVWNSSTRKSGKKVIIILLILCVSGDIMNANPIKSNIKQLMGKAEDNVSGYTSWKAFYSEDLFDNIKDYIGEDTSEYKVASIGLYPSIAMYNGFYCIDGYSNNYELQYKHNFRKIISKELDKNDGLKTYFDEWGNRCYLFVSQIPYEYQIKKEDTRVLTDLELDTAQLKKMGCSYLLSALPIESEKMDGKIEFCKKFEKENSPYSIYLYKVIS